MSDESSASDEQLNNDSLPPIVLRRDEILGVFACVPAEEAEGLREWLIESRTSFLLDPERAARLAIPGHRTFLFGIQHPGSVREQIVDYGLKAEVDPGLQLTETSYRPPLNKLLELGAPKRRDGEMDCGAHGITGEHIPELIRMVLDEELHTGPDGSPVVFAPLYAWRALGQLRAVEAIAPLLGLLLRIDIHNDDWVSEDLPHVFAAIGPVAITQIADYVADSANGEWARVAAIRSLAAIAAAHPEARDECVARLRAQLEFFADQSPSLNAFLVSELLDLCAVEAAALIEQAFVADRVDEAVFGDWEDAAIKLGLKSKRERPRRPNRLTQFRDVFLPAPSGGQEFDSAGSGFPSEQRPMPVVAPPKVGRNDPCPCGSDKKFKKCCGQVG